VSRRSAAMTADIDAQLQTHLLRDDGDEDVCLATYRPSTGSDRTSAVLRRVILPRDGERLVHGNASFTGDYLLRGAAEAAADGCGLAMLHSHPGGRGWQSMSGPDHDAEQSYARLAHTITGKPLIGFTLGGRDGGWSMRNWTPEGRPEWAESVRVVGDCLRVTWNDRLCPPPQLQKTQDRTVSAWGERIQADLARLWFLVVGAGSVGLDVALRLAASGVRHVAVMDFDGVYVVNLDRLIGATRLDVLLCRSKVEVALRLMRAAATAASPDLQSLEMSVCTSEGLAAALDYDVIVSCVDRPWPRAALNGIAYADLIPVVDGGIGIDAFDDGDGMRNATWRSHVVRPGRPCLSCNGQLDLGDVQLDKQGLLDDPRYLAAAGRNGQARQNVAALSASVSASLLAQVVSLVAAPGGRGEPGPLRYTLSAHWLEHVDATTREGCAFEHVTAAGDRRHTLTGPHAAATETAAARAVARRQLRVRAAAALARLSDRLATAARAFATFGGL